MELLMRMSPKLNFSLFALLFIILNYNMNCVDSLEPFSTGVAMGTAMLASAFLASFRCKYYECCEDTWIKNNITGLEKTLQEKVHGQHLVLNSVVKAVRGHVKNKSPSKALVLSFHGWTGSGKNHVSRIVAESIYKMGMGSQFVHLFVATLHFPHESKLESYKDQLTEWIKGNVSACPQSMFIFDEMDKMPHGLIDTIKPYLDHYSEINGVDYRKTIFIFLSNIGGSEINSITIEQWKSGKERKSITLKDMEESINMGAFNQQGGLWHSTLIEKNLINVYVPFLPLERQHVKLCIRDDLRQKQYPVTKKIIDKVADELQYFPTATKLFSKTGCKRVSAKVDLIIEEMDHN